MEMNTLDVLIRLEFPSIPSSWGLTDFFLTETNSTSQQYQQESEVIFRFTYDSSIVRYGLGAISALFLPALAHAYEESTKKKTDYDISTLWSALKEQLEENAFIPTNVVPPQPLWLQDSFTSIQKGDLKLASSGVGGTYFVSGVNEANLDPIAVFKPVDEEPGAPNNPKATEGFVPMLPWGYGANREVAAYKLGSQFVDVPETFFIEATNPEGQTKIGSLQKFVASDGDCSDFGANKFSVDSVHRLGVFDISILNMDRNDENLLVQKCEDGSGWKLIPIDHTYCFPNKIDSYFNWQYWSQSKKPFSPELLALISGMNPLANAQILLETGIDEESIRNVITSTLLLQKAAEKGLNLFQIASMVSGKKNDLVNILSLTVEKEQLYYQSFNGGNMASLSLKKRLSIYKDLSEAIICEKFEK
jgi:hypothetical protein